MERLQGNYSESYCYDQNCNLTWLQRTGTSNSVKGKVIDLLECGYSGNQLKRVTDYSDEELNYVGAFDFQNKADKEHEYTYNKNGAMTQDLNKGIDKIEYDLLGNPQKVTFSDKNSIEYVYAADVFVQSFIDLSNVEWNLSYGKDKVYTLGTFHLLERCPTRPDDKIRWAIHSHPRVDGTPSALQKDGNTIMECDWDNVYHSYMNWIQSDKRPQDFPRHYIYHKYTRTTVFYDAWDPSVPVNDRLYHVGDRVVLGIPQSESNPYRIYE